MGATDRRRVPWYAESGAGCVCSAVCMADGFLCGRL